MNPSPQVRSAIYLVLAMANIIVCAFLIVTKQFTSEVLIGLTGLNTIVLGLANANVPKA